MDNAMSIKDAIENLSSKREEVLTKEAVMAKQAHDQAFQQIQGSPAELGQYRRHQNTVGAFTDSIFLLQQIFRDSKFDELALFISKPRRMIIYQFLIGLSRGLGFCISVLFFLYLFVSFS